MSSTKKLFHMIFPNIYLGDDLPGSLKIESMEDVNEYIETIKDEALFISTLFLSGAEGKICTTSMAYIDVPKGIEGWSITTGATETGERELYYVTPEKGNNFQMQFDGYLYMVITQIPSDVIDENLSEENVMEILKPSYDYLESLL